MNKTKKEQTKMDKDEPVDEIVDLIREAKP